MFRLVQAFVDAGSQFSQTRLWGATQWGHWLLTVQLSGAREEEVQGEVGGRFEKRACFEVQLVGQASVWESKENCGAHAHTHTPSPPPDAPGAEPLAGGAGYT